MSTEVIYCSYNYITQSVMLTPASMYKMTVSEKIL